jgi:CheY-like chemotaxis protein
VSLAASIDPVDLIICDMNLPDGTGLDFVRHVRAGPAWQCTPIVMLSSDVDPARVGLAYALGANAYVEKGRVAWSLTDIVTMLYGHWLGGLTSDPGAKPDPLQQYLARIANHRARHARLFQRIADEVATTGDDSRFWLGEALRELNASNVIAFLRRKLVEKDIPAELVAKMASGADRVEARLSAAEHALDGGTMTLDKAYRHLLELLSAMSYDGLAGAINHLVRSMPVAMAAASEVLFGSIHDVVTWMQTHVDDVSLRERALQLQAGATASFRTAALAV